MDMATSSVISIENGKTDPIENGNIDNVASPGIAKNEQNEVANEEKQNFSEKSVTNNKNHVLDEEKRESQECEVEKLEQQSKKRPHETSENNKEEQSENDNQSHKSEKRARRVSENENELTSKSVEKSNKIEQRRNSEEQVEASEEDKEEKDDGDKSSKKKRVRRHSAVPNSESDEPRQLRRRQPQTPSNSKSEKTETPAKTKVEKRDKKMAVAESISKNPKKKSDPDMKPSKKRKTVGHKKQDAYDFDDDNTEEISSIPPLKHVHVGRGNFMEMKFTKAPAEEVETPSKPKFTALSQSAEKRRRESSKSQRNSSPLKFTASSGSVSQSSSSRKKDSLSPGRTADISSSDSKQTGSTMPKSTPSSGLKASTDLSSNEKSPHKSFEKSMSSSGTKRASSGGVRAGSQSLFSDVEQKVCDDFDKEEFLSSGHQQPSRKTPSTSRRKQAIAASTSDEDSDADDVAGVSKTAQRDASRSTSRKRGRPTAIDRSRSTPKMDVSSSDRSPVSTKRRTTASLTPKPKQPTLPQFTAEEQLNVDFPSSSTPHLLPGARVLAKWVDKSYYPAHIILDLGLGRYKVRFAADGFYKDMPAPAIVALARLKAGDRLSYNLHVGENDTELQPVEIKQVPSATDSEAWFAGQFEVYNAITDTTEKISWEKFIIDEDNIKSFVKNLTNKAAFEIVADNISESRVRRNRGKRAESLEPEEETMVPPEKPAPKRRTTMTPKRAHSPAVTKKLRASHTDSPRPRPGTSSAQLVAAFEYAAAGQTISEESPESSIFDGIKFVLTSANRVRITGSENSEEEKNLIPFNKKQIRLMIDQRGGLVVDEFTSLADIRDCFLIADQFYRTHKYLSALARAVPCVSHMWIHDCCNKETCLPFENYILPAGQSLETNQIIEWHSDCPTLLSGMRVFVYTENRPTNPGALDFVQIWAPLVRCMAATLLDDLPDAEDGNHVDILLTDISCPDHVLSKAAKLGAQAVSSEWLIQAIITGQRPQPTSHQKYRYDFAEQPVLPSLV